MERDNHMQAVISQIPIIAKRVGRMIDYRLPEFEDLQSEIMCDLIQFVQSGKFRGTASIGTITYTITRRRILDNYRRKYRRNNYAEYMAVTERPPVPPCVQFETRAAIKSAMSYTPKLPPRIRKMIAKVYVDGMTIDEAAATTSIKPESARRYLRTANRLFAL